MKSAVLLDVSKWQGVIDWNKLAQTKKADAVYIRAGTVLEVRDEIQTDVFFEKNTRGANENGLPFGCYWTVSRSGSITPEKQSDYFAGLLQKRQREGYGSHLLPVVDVELKNLTPEYVYDFVTKCDSLFGYAVGIYTRVNFWYDLFGNDTSLLVGRFLWLANYQNFSEEETTLLNTQFEKPQSAISPILFNGIKNYNLWQISSSGIIDGITANTVDINFYNGTKSDLYLDISNGWQDYKLAVQLDVIKPVAETNLYTYQDVINALAISAYENDINPITLYAKLPFVISTTIRKKIYDGADAKKYESIFGEKIASRMFSLLDGIQKKEYDSSYIIKLVITSKNNYELRLLAQKESQLPIPETSTYTNRISRITQKQLPKLLYGLHGSTDGGFRDVDIELLKQAGFKSGKLLSNGSAYDIGELIKNGCSVNTVRLYSNRNLTNKDEYATVMLEQADKFLKDGNATLLIELHNEYNLQYKNAGWEEGLGTLWKNGYECAEYQLLAYKTIKAKYPYATVGWAGLSMGLDDESSMYKRAEERKFFLESRSAWEAMDFVCFHYYYTYPDWNVGALETARWYRKQIGNVKPLIISEISWNANVSDEEKAKQYLRVLNTLETAEDCPVDAIYFFTASGSSQYFSTEYWHGKNIAKIIGENTRRTNIELANKPYGETVFELYAHTPYFSQLKNTFRNNCGAACLAMMAKWKYPQVVLNPDDIKRKFTGDKNRTLGVSEIVSVGRNIGLPISYRAFVGIDSYKNFILENLKQSEPVMLLLDYGKLNNNKFGYKLLGHYIIVSGYDAETQKVLILDPLDGERTIPLLTLIQASSPLAGYFYTRYVIYLE